MLLHVSSQQRQCRSARYLLKPFTVRRSSARFADFPPNKIAHRPPVSALRLTVHTRCNGCRVTLRCSKRAGGKSAVRFRVSTSTTSRPRAVGNTGRPAHCVFRGFPRAREEENRGSKAVRRCFVAIRAVAGGSSGLCEIDTFSGSRWEREARSSRSPRKITRFRRIREETRRFVRSYVTEKDEMVNPSDTNAATFRPASPGSWTRAKVHKHCLQIVGNREAIT